MSDLDIGRLIGYVELDDTGVAAGAKGAEDKIGELGRKGPGLAKAAGLGMGLALGAGLMAAVDAEGANAKLTAQLGLSASESERYGALAGNLYSGAYGQSLEEVNAAIAGVVQNVGGMADASDADLERITGRVMSVAQAFDQDLGATSRAVGTMLKNGLAKDADEALDVLARGFQNGTNVADDLLDTFSEYSTQFRALGLDADEALGLMSQGLKGGARDADTVADALKEFAIRAVDGSEASATAYEALGLSASAMGAQIAQGGDKAEAGLSTVLDRLRAMPDPVARNAAAVGLFGTKAEDLAGALGALNTETAVEGLGDVAGAAARVDETMGGTLSASLSKLSREFTTLLGESVGPLVPVLTDLASTVLDTVAPPLELVGGLVETLGGWFADLPGPVQIAIVALGGIAAARGPIADTFDGIKGAASSALETVQLRAMFAREAIAGAGGGLTGAMGAASTAAGGLARGGLGAVAGVLGGPLGIGLAAATIGIPLLSSLFDDNSDTADEAARANSNLADAIRQSSGAINDNVRAAAAKEAQDKGLLDSASAAGIDLELVTEALLGNNDALDTVTSGLRSYGDAQKEWRVTSAGSAEFITDEGIAARNAATELEGLAQTYPETVAGAKQIAEATGEHADETKDATPIVDEYGRTIEGAADSAEDLLKALDNLNGGTLNLRDAQRAHQEALDSATEAIEKHGRNLDINTEAGRANNEALDGIAKSATDMANAILENGGSYTEFRTNLEGGRKDLLEQARAFGMSEEGAAAYVESVLAIPSEAATRIEQPGIERAQQLAELLGDTILDVPNDKTIHTSALTDDAMGRLANLGYTVKVLPDGTVNVVAKTAAAEEELRRVTRVREIEARLTVVGPQGQRGYRIPGMGTILEAAGGIVEAYADGGWHDSARAAGLTPMPAGVAQRVPANTWRVIGDRALGDEFYLPDDDDPRSLAIGAEWLRRRGLGAIPLARFAGGAVASSSSTSSPALAAALAGLSLAVHIDGNVYGDEHLRRTIADAGDELLERLDAALTDAGVHP